MTTISLYQNLFLTLPGAYPTLAVILHELTQLGWCPSSSCHCPTGPLKFPDLLLLLPHLATIHLVIQTTLYHSGTQKWTWNKIHQDQASCCSFAWAYPTLAVVLHELTQLGWCPSSSCNHPSGHTDYPLSLRHPKMNLKQDTSRSSLLL